MLRLASAIMTGREIRSSTGSAGQNDAASASLDTPLRAYSG